MIRVGVEQAKAAFFSVEKVQRQMDKAEQAALSRAGAFIRQRAKTSIRSRKAISEPGNPPSAHKNSPLKKYLFFMWDSSTRSVVVGPALWTGGATKQNVPAPAALEEGAVVQAIDRRGRPVRRNYHSRPYMGPALMAEVAAGTIPDQFRGSIGG